MSWEVLVTDWFTEWWHTLSEDQQDQVIAAVDVLEEKGPALGRPLVDTIKSSRYPHMKELRVSKGGVLRILFIFDPLRRALLLLGGDKEGSWDAWYRRAVPEADALYQQYLQELREEGELP